MQIRTIIGFSCANLGTNPRIALIILRKPRPRVVLALPRSHTFLVTKLAYAYLQPGVICNCRSYRKQSASLRRPNKGAEKACVYARLPRGAKLAGSNRHTRFVCAIPGLSRGARMRFALGGANPLQPCPRSAKVMSRSIRGRLLSGS